MRKLTAAAASIAVGTLGGSRADATVIYSGVFTGPSSTFLNGTAPTVRNNAGGEIGASATWVGGVAANQDYKADGSVNNTAALYGTAYLPFTPAAGKVYDITYTSAGAGQFFGLSTAAVVITTTNGANRLIDAGGGAPGYNIMLHRTATNVNGDQYFQGPGTSTPATNAPLNYAGGNINADLRILLDTTGSNWVSTLYERDGSAAGNAFRSIVSYTFTGGATAMPTHFLTINEAPGNGAHTNGDISVVTSSVWNTDADANWTDASSWNGGVPNAGDAEADLFSAITASRNVNIGSGVTVGIVRFNSAVVNLNGDGTANSRSYTLTGAGSLAIQSSLTSGGVIDIQSGAEQINVPVTLSSNTTINIATGTSVSFGNSIAAGPGSLTVTGVGTVNLQPTNSYGGGTILKGGTLAGYAGSASFFGTSTNVTFNGGTLQYAPSTTTDLTASGLTISLLAGGAGIDTNNNNVTFSNAFGPGGAGPFTKLGAGTLTFGAANTYTGATNVSGGTLQLGVAGAVPSATAMTVSSGATFDLNGFNQSLGSLAGAGTVIGTANLTVGSSGANTTFSGALTNVGSLTKNGAGVLTLSGTNTYGGGTTINGGRLVYSTASSLPSSGTILINSAGSLSASGAIATVTGWLAKIDPSSAGAIALTANSAEAINMAGFNTLMLGAAANATYTGTLTPANSTYRLGGGGATLTLSNANALTGANSLVVGATGSTGTVALTNSNNYSGGTTLNTGTLQIGNTGALGANALNIAFSATLQAGANNLAPTNAVVMGTGVTGTVDTQANTLTLGGIISDTLADGVLKKIGTGNLVLAGSNTYGGGTSLTAGTVTISALNNLGTGAVSFTGGATLQYATGLGSPPDISSRTVTLGTGGGTINTNGNNVAFASGIGNGGAGALTKAGVGTLTLSATNTYTGGSTINGGSLQFNSGGVPASGVITINGGGALNTAPGAFPTVTSILTSGKVVAAAAGAIALTGNSSETINMAGFNSLMLGAAANANYTGLLIPANGVYHLGGGGATLTLPNSNELSGVGNVLTIGNNVAGASGTVVLTSANNFGGAVTLLGGSTLRFSALNNLGTGAAADTNQQIAISGGTLQWAAGNTDDITARNVFVFSGGATFDTNGNNVVFNNSFGGNGGTVTKTGAGSLTLNSATVLIGTTQVSGGSLVLGHSLALQNETLNYNSLGGTLSFGTLTSATFGGLSGNQNLDLTNVASAGVALTNGNIGATTAYSGNLIGAGSLTHAGGTISLSGHSTYSGATAVRAGTMTLAFGTTGTSNILPAATALSLGGGTLSVTASGASAASQSFASTTLTERNSTIADTLTTAGANVLLGAITRNTGATVNLLNVPATGTGSFTTTTANSSFVGGLQTILGGHFIATSNTWAVSGTGATPGAITGLPTGSYSTTFAPGLDVDAPASATPATMTINSLRFSTAGAHTVGNFSDGTTLTIANGGILNASTSGGVSLLDDSLTSGNGQDLIFWSLGSSGIAVASVVTGNIGVTLASGTINLQNSNNYTGPTTINGGTLQFFDNTSLGNGGAINFRGGILQYAGSTDDISARTIDIGFGGGTINTNGGNVNFANAIGNSGVGAFTKAGAGTLTLNGANSWQGTTTVSTGTLDLATGTMASKIYSVSSGATMTIEAGADIATASDLTDNGTVNYNNAALLLNTLSGSGTLNLPNGTALTLLNGPSPVTLTATSNFQGPITGSGASITIVNGTTSLSGANTYTGATNLNGGVLAIGASALGGGGAINFNGGVLQYGGGNTLDISTHTVTFGGAAAIIDTNGNNVTFANPVGNSGTGGLVKIGLGTLTLGAVNTFTGSTTVTLGKLQVTPPLVTSPAVVIDGAGTLEVTTNGSHNKVLRAGSVAVTGGGKIDIQDNKIITQSAVGTATAGVYNGVSGLIQSGRNGGGWGGSGIVTSQSTATTGNFTTLGVASAAQVKGIAPTATAVWAGQTVTGSDTLVMYTYGGDANLDGKINVDDYTRIDFNVPLGASGWYNGDFNYDGKINVDDYTIIDFNVGIQGAQFPTGAGAGALSGVSAVPEPTSIAVLGFTAATGLLPRRRRRK